VKFIYLLDIWTCQVSSVYKDEPRWFCKPYSYLQRWVFPMQEN